MNRVIYGMLFFLLFSCANVEEQIYDVVPGELFPENEAQSALVVINAYKELADLIDDAGWWFWMQEVTSDEIVFPTRFTDWDDGGKWRVLHTHEWDNNTDGVNSMWSHMYDGVTEANSALDGLAGSTDEPTLITSAKLKVLRAFYYYLLIDNYGDVPYATTLIGVPENPEKTPKAEIWQNIVDDIKESLPLLPTSTNNFAVSKGLAYTLLAKLYLNKEIYTGSADWQMTEAYCDSVIDLGTYTLSSSVTAPFAAANDNNPENIFTIPFDENNLKGFRLHMRTLHYQSDETFGMVVGPWNGFAVVEDHYNSYTNNDARKNWFLVGPQQDAAGQVLFDETAEADVVFTPNIPALNMDGSYSFPQIRLSGARVAKYEIESGAEENLNNDFPLFRYADVLLMKAEAIIRQGGNGDEWVNQIRRRAGLSDWSNVTLDRLLEERGRELFAEGHRRQDLIRFGEFNSSWWEKPASTSDRNIFPIPQWAIDENPNLN